MFLSISKVPIKDLREASEALVKALMMREKYMAMALHSFPRTTAMFLQKLDKDTKNFTGETELEDAKTLEGTLLVFE